MKLKGFFGSYSIQMKRTDETYVVMHRDEKNLLKEALKRDFSEEGRISLGAYARTLAERRLAEMGEAE